jgi:hypothetical protein
MAVNSQVAIRIPASLLPLHCSSKAVIDVSTSIDRLIPLVPTNKHISPRRATTFRSLPALVKL